MEDLEQVKNILEQALTKTGAIFYDRHNRHGDLTDYETDLIKQVHEGLANLFLEAGGTTDAVLQINRMTASNIAIRTAIRKVYGNGR